MTSQDARSFIHRTRIKYLALRFFESAITGFAAFLLCLALFDISRIDFQVSIIISIIVGILVFGFRSFQLGLFRFQETAIAHFLNEQYKELEESSDLILQDEVQLSTLQKIQKQRIAERLNAMTSQIGLPHRIGLSLVMLSTGILLYFLVQIFDFRIDLSQPKLDFSQQSIPESTPAQDKIIAVAGTRVTIEPPAYTALQRISKEDLNLNIPESSRVKWQIKFTLAPSVAWLSFSDKDSIAL
jgi:hypothetical protein